MPAKGRRKKEAVVTGDNVQNITVTPSVIHADLKVAKQVAKTREDYRMISNNTDGWLTEAEANLLVKVAAERANAAEENLWVEDGSYHGKSSVLLAGELALFGEGKLYCVDPHTGDLSYPSRFQDGLLTGEPQNVGTTIEQFRATIERAGVGQFVSEIITSFQNFAVDHGTITLAFIDGLHDYDSVKADWEHLKPMLHDSATVGFHDVGQWYGPTQVTNEAVAKGELQLIESADSLFVYRFLGAK